MSHKYECEVTTGANVVAYYSGTVEVWADDEDQARERAAKEGQRRLMWGSPLKVREVRRVG